MQINVWILTYMWLCIVAIAAGDQMRMRNTFASVLMMGTALLPMSYARAAELPSCSDPTVQEQVVKQTTDRITAEVTSGSEAQIALAIVSSNIKVLMKDVITLSKGNCETIFNIIIRVTPRNPNDKAGVFAANTINNYYKNKLDGMNLREKYTVQLTDEGKVLVLIPESEWLQ
jgi:hypothetical protein